MKKKLLAILVVLITTFAHTPIYGQSGINTLTPDASAALQIDSRSGTSQGILIPSVALTATNAALPVVLPAPTLFVYNTATAGIAPNNVVPGYYYNAGTAASPNWVRLLTQFSGWQTTGNTGTNPSVNFLGTADATDFLIKTGNPTTGERVRFLGSGSGVIFNDRGVTQNFRVEGNADTALIAANASTNRVGMGTVSPNVKLEIQDVSAGSIVNNLILRNADNTTGTGVSLKLINSTSSVTVGTEIQSIRTNTNGATNTIISSHNGSSGLTEKIRILGDGRIAMNNTAPDVADLLTVTSSTAFPYAINGYNAQTSGSGLYASNTNTANTFSALDGDHNGTAGSGVLGSYVGTFSGPDVSGVTGQYTGSGSGVKIGVKGYSGGTGNQNIGVYGTYNGVSYWGLGLVGIAAGGGIPTGNNDIAVVGWRANNSNYSGYFNGNHVIANGTKSASVGTSKGNQLLYVTETPGVWFEDIGSAQLVNGKAVVNLDPLFLETVFIDSDHPMQVFVQEQGECNDLYVIPGTISFEVIEKQGGTSNIRFSYRIMAKRLNFQDHRFGCDPIWGSGDTRKYNQYATPPPVDYEENIEFQEQQKKSWKPTPIPDGFTYEFGTSQKTKSQNQKGASLNKNEGLNSMPDTKKGSKFKNRNK